MKNPDRSPINEDLVPGSEKLFFFFGGIAGAIGMPPFEFYNASRILDFSKVFLRDFSQSWYQSAVPTVGDDVHAIGQYLRSVIEKSGASKIRFVGNSMGGYAALLFCSMLQCGKAIVFSPQSFVSIEKRLKYGDGRWAPQISAMHYSHGASGIYDLKPWIQDHFPEIQAEVYVSAVDDLDVVHANELSGFTGVNIHRFAEGGHQLVSDLRNGGHLARILNW